VSLVLLGLHLKATTIDTTIRTAIELAARRSHKITYATLSGVLDTFRLLNDSMDFSDENGNAWDVLETLCDRTLLVVKSPGEIGARVALLLWMLKLSSSEMRICPVRSHLVSMLGWVVPNPYPGLEQASDLLLNLGGAELIDVPPDYTGYTILQQIVGYAYELESLCSVLSKGPDLYRLSVDYHFTPQEESPTSLSMYSSWAFRDWLDGLDSIQVGLEEFVEQELERNHAVHAGWEKETLLGLFAYNYRTDLDARLDQRCSDCSEWKHHVNVQPYWRHLIERIKQGLDPDSPAQAGSEVDEEEDADSGSIAEAASSSSDVSLDDLDELPSDSDEEDIHGYPATVSIRSDCIYAWHEFICMDCWLWYRNYGTRRPPQDWTQAQDWNQGFVTDAGEDSSLDEFSPYLIHS